MPRNQTYVLAIDQGTSSTKTLLFDGEGQAVAKGVEPLQTSYLSGGFVEQDPGEIFQNVLGSVAKCLEEFTKAGGQTKDIIACGISNQRESFVVWDESGTPLYNAVVWQCKRSVAICQRLKQEGLDKEIKEKTGLIIDPYFSGTKLIWLYENVEAVRQAIDNGKAFFGTIDTWLLFRLTKGRSYATDYTNASRTLFFNLQTLEWDRELLEGFGLKKIQLAEVRPSAYNYGKTDLGGLLSHQIPVTAMIGDSHAAAFGEGCFEAGTAKATLGTGCSILMNIGTKPVWSRNGMMTTICWSTEDKIAFALEGVIVSCGSTIEWLMNELKLFSKSHESEALARSVSTNGGVYLIPAFSGLGSPHWQMDGRAVISGLSFDTTKNHIVRAALESIAYQVQDVAKAMEDDLGFPIKELMVNGGMTANEFVMQFLADLLEIKIRSGDMKEISALGAAFLAGLKIGLYKNMEQLKSLRSHNRLYSGGTGVEIAKNAYLVWQEEIRHFKSK